MEITLGLLFVTHIFYLEELVGVFSAHEFA